MIVKWRSYEEIVFNIQTYHGETLAPYQHERIRKFAGKEIDIRPSMDKDPLGRCDLPIFEEVNPDTSDGWGIHVCGHVCEID